MSTFDSYSTPSFAKLLLDRVQALWPLNSIAQIIPPGGSGSGSGPDLDNIAPGTCGVGRNYPIRYTTNPNYKKKDDVEAVAVCSLLFVVAERHTKKITVDGGPISERCSTGCNSKKISTDLVSSGTKPILECISLHSHFWVWAIPNKLLKHSHQQRIDDAFAQTNQVG